MVHATQVMGLGLGGMIMLLALAHMVHSRKSWVWVGGDDNVPCTCTHGSGYASHGFGLGGMIMFLALAHMVQATQVIRLGLG